MTTRIDIVDLATKFALTPTVRFNPGLPLTVDYRPVTLPPNLGDKQETTENIYKLSHPHRHTSGICSLDINAKVLRKVLEGGHGCSTDYAGCLMLVYFRRDPEAWDNLFSTRNHRRSVSEIINLITGVPRFKITPFIQCADALFVPGYEQDPIEHEKVLRSMQEF